MYLVKPTGEFEPGLRPGHSTGQCVGPQFDRFLPRDGVLARYILWPHVSTSICMIDYIPIWHVFRFT